MERGIWSGHGDTVWWRYDTLRHMRYGVVVCLLGAGLLAAQSAEENYKAYTEAPRLLLRPARLRLLTRERERQSIRYQQFETYTNSGAAMPEMGFAYALAARVTGKKEYCAKAKDATAKGTPKDVRQMAIVVDWCSEMVPGIEAKSLVPLIPPMTGIKSLRDRVFAAMALMDADAVLAEKTMRETVKYWREKVAPGLRGTATVARDDIYPLLEFLHAVRDNLEIDLRQDAPQYFLDLPLVQMLSYYPAPYPGPDNEFRIAFFTGDGDPDLKQATLLRAAELAMVAFDNNAELSQSLQGWLLQDRYLLRSPFGIPYEFLWANPYQPGLTYHHLPNSLHDRRTGMLFIRDSWEEEAKFLCYYDGKIQLFEEGKRRLLRVSPTTPMMELGGATVMVGAPDLIKPLQFQLHGEDREAWYLIGLKPDHLFAVEVDDQELEETRTDSGGILSLDYLKPVKGAGVRLMPLAERKGGKD